MLRGARASFSCTRFAGCTSPRRTFVPDSRSAQRRRTSRRPSPDRTRRASRTRRLRAHRCSRSGRYRRMARTACRWEARTVRCNRRRPRSAVGQFCRMLRPDSRLPSRRPATRSTFRCWRRTGRSYGRSIRRPRMCCSRSRSGPAPRTPSTSRPRRLPGSTRSRTPCRNPRCPRRPCSTAVQARRTRCRPRRSRLRRRSRGHRRRPSPGGCTFLPSSTSQPAAISPVTSPPMVTFACRTRCNTARIARSEVHRVEPYPTRPILRDGLRQAVVPPYH